MASSTSPAYLELHDFDWRYASAPVRGVLSGRVHPSDQGLTREEIPRGKETAEAAETMAKNLAFFAGYYGRTTSPDGSVEEFAIIPEA